MSVVVAPCAHQPRSALGMALLLLTCVTLPLAGCDARAITENGVLGIIGGRGLGQGKFSYPRCITVEPSGSIFIIDKTGRVQRFSPQGEFETLWTMPEIAGGKPVGLTVHKDGRIFVADTHYHRVSIFDRDGNSLGSFGTEGVGDGEFLLPTDVAIDDAGFIYVSEYQGNDRITKWSPALEFVGALAEMPIEGRRLSRPAGIDIDRDQTLWIADACNHRIVHLSLDGDVLSVFGEFGEESGKLRYPYDITVTPEDQLMVCEYQGNRLQWFAKDGRSLKTWGTSGRKPGELFAPWGATYGSGGVVYVVDSRNDRVQMVRP